MAKRVLIILGTRPEAIKLLRVIAALREEPGIELLVCSTGQHRELLAPILALGGITPDLAFEVMRAGQSLDALEDALFVTLRKAIADSRPDIVIVQGDTATALCGALAAHEARIPVAHVEAGLRSGDLAHPWPEEGYRRRISAVASLHFAPTADAVAALRGEGHREATIHLTGNSGIDTLLWIRGLGLGADWASLHPARRIVAVTTHRRENRAALAGIARALEQIAARDDVAVLVAAHPDPEIRAVLDRTAGLEIIDALPYPDFVALLDQAALVLTDSGGVQEEAPALGTPVLVMRKTTERREAIDAGAALLVGTDPGMIVGETRALLDDPVRYAAMARVRFPFGDGGASARIARIIASA